MSTWAWLVTALSLICGGTFFSIGVFEINDSARMEHRLEQYRTTVRACAAATDHAAFYRCVKEATPR